MQSEQHMNNILGTDTLHVVQHWKQRLQGWGRLWQQPRGRMSQLQCACMSYGSVSRSVIVRLALWLPTRPDWPNSSLTWLWKRRSCSTSATAASNTAAVGGLNTLMFVSQQTPGIFVIICSRGGKGGGWDEGGWSGWAWGVATHWRTCLVGGSGLSCMICLCM